ncbi:hypothetical protein N7541_000137 [Penicillium brevicompactum]|uniref:Uncharacterized protein n=1 Tax=Penicillium brevicompactum TaxID=5074 RepID=A0A9W9RTT5_PENBR|nr:hypothetical protein N7541_000137 [Penicillium brevicompactum]
MPILNHLPADVLSGGTKILQAGLEGAKLTAAYGKPALENSVNVTVQAAKWSTQNPVLAACVVVGASGAAVFAAPGLATAPALSIMGFKAGGIHAGSAAAAAHGFIGNIAAGSAMAIGQSAGAGGCGLLVFSVDQSQVMNIPYKDKELFTTM